VLPSHSCGGILQNLHLKLLHSSTQMSADRQSGQRQVSRMTDEKGETWSGMSKVRSRPERWQTVPCPYCSHQKGAVAKGSPTSRRHPQCSGVSRAETVTSDDLRFRPQADRQVRRCCAMHTTVCQNTQPELDSLQDILSQ